MRSPAMLRCVLRILDELRKVNPDVMYGMKPLNLRITRGSQLLG